MDKKGFTLVELMLAMGFVSALLLAIAMTVIQIGNIYTHGLTYKNVNQAGGAIANELQHSIDNSTAFDLDSSHYIANISAGKTIGGRLCTGGYSYIWNLGIALNPNLDANRYQNSSGADIRFVKIYDSSNSYCTTPAKKPDSSSIELIDAGQYDLAIQGFNVITYPSTADSATGQQLYSIVFSLGTNDQSAFDIGTTNCSASGPTSNPSYCSVNQFNVLARAGSSPSQ